MPHTRVETAEVKEILETNLKNDALEPFMLAANRIVEDILVGRTYTKPDATVGTVSDATLKEVERWLAAHFAAMWDKRVESDKVGPGAFKYEGKTRLYLEFTRYGQQAALLDPTGALKEVGSADAKPPFLYSATGGTPKEEAAPEGALA